MKISLNKFIILFIGLIDVLQIGIFIPTLPDLVSFYNVSAHTISYSISIYAIFAFFSGTILGQLSDIYGRKKILILCLIGSLISAGMMVVTSSFLIFMLARVINGATGGNISILSSMLSDMSTDKKDRMSNMGMIGALFGFGFIIGPILGSILLPFGVKAPFLLLTILSLVEIIFAFFFLKETNKHLIQKKINYNVFSSIIKYAKDDQVNIFLISLFILLFSFSLYNGMLPIFLVKEFGLPGYMTGYVLSVNGLITALTQLILLRKFWLRFFSLKTLFYIINFGAFSLFLILFLTKNFVLFIIFLFTLVFIQGIVYPIYQSEIVEKTHLHNRGEIIGLFNSIQSICMFAGPLISGLCIDRNISMFGFGVIFIFINLLIISKLVKKIYK